MDTRTNLRKILGWEEALSGFVRQENGQRLYGRQGVAWLDGHGPYNREPDEEEAEQAEKKKESVGTRTGERDGQKAAHERIEKGDEIRGLEDLRDCQSGRCLNLRLDGYVRPPEGWRDGCTPPDAGEAPPCFWKTHYVDSYAKIDRYVYHTSKEAAIAAMDAFLFGRYRESGDNDWYGFPLEEPFVFTNASLGEWARQLIDNCQHYINNNTNRHIFAKCGRWPYDKCQRGWINVSGAVYLRGRVDYTKEWEKMQGEQRIWPQEVCSEVAWNDGFAAACDPHLPKGYLMPQQELLLCDKNGNRVHVRKTADGFEIRQEKFGKTVTVGHDFIVR